jgi:hypothetical protein
MITPTVHLNGTSREELLHQYIAALEAIRGAHDALCAMSPHGRDYYPQGPDAFQIARQEHQDRLASLEGLRMEIEELAFALDRTAGLTGAA